jgi:hypothetical protein
MTLAEGAVALGGEGGGWLRSSALADGWSSPLDEGRLRDAHRSAAIAGPDSSGSGPAGPPRPGHSDGDDDADPIPGETTGAPAPGAGAIGGTAGPAMGAIAGAGAGDGDGPRPDGGLAGGDRPGAANNRDDGEGSWDGESSASDRGRPTRDTGPATGGPDGERFPFVLHPDAPALVLGEELGTLVDRGSGHADADSRRPPAADLAGETAPRPVDPPVLADHDPIGPPAAAPPPAAAAPPPADPGRAPGEDGLHP